MPKTAGGDSTTSSKPAILWILWMTYGSFYFCRTNIAAAVPGMEAELGLSKIEIGTILGSLKIAYGVGQLINGQLAEVFRPRRLLAIGMMLSAVLNVVFGLGSAFYFLLFVWAMNGYSQSLGWTPCMKVASHWIPAERRGRGDDGDNNTIDLEFAASTSGGDEELFLVAVLVLHGRQSRHGDGVVLAKIP